MPEQRRRFSPQFKAEAVQMVLETGRPIAEVARDLGIHDGTLGNWVNAWRREHPEPDQPPDAGGARARERAGRRDPPAADGERVPEKSRGLLRPDATVADAVRGDRRGEGQLPDRLDVPAAGRAPLLVLRLARTRSSTRPRPPPAGGCWPSSSSGVRRQPRHLRLPAGRGRAQPARAPGQRRAGRRSDARARAGRRASRGPTSVTTVPGRGAGGQPGPDRAGVHRRRHRGSGWSGTSPTCAPAKGGCIWPR